MINIIQIGCNDGNDHVFTFIKTLSDFHIHLLDASAVALDKCKDTYKGYNSSFYNLAITNTNQESIKLYIPKEHPDSQHASLLHSHLEKHRHSQIDEIDVPSQHINTFLCSLNLSHIDYLFIDVEGLDTELIDAIDLTMFDIKNIRFEILHSDGAFSKGGPKLEKCKNKLIENNYSLCEDGWDMIVTKKL